MATSNFLLEVLARTDTATLEEFREALLIVNEKLNHLKNELVLSLGSSFGTFDSDIQRVSSWFAEVHGVEEETGKLSKQLENEKFAQTVSSEELGFVQEELYACDNNIYLLKALVEVVQNMESADPSEIFIAASRLRKSENAMRMLIQDFFQLEQFEWVKGLQTAISSRIDQTYEMAMNEWDSKFHFDHNTLVVDPETGKGDIPNLVDALQNLGYFQKQCELFCLQIWRELLSKACTPNYTVKITQPNLSKSSSKKPMLLAAKDIPVRDTDADPESPGRLQLPEAAAKFGSTSAIVVHVKRLNTPITDASVVFKNIQRLLSQLAGVFGDKRIVMIEMGKMLGPKLVNQLSAKCLKSLILQQSKGSMEKAKENILHLLEFREQLNELSFRIEEDSEAIFDHFVTNFDNFFMSQVREDTLARVRFLIQSDLHHTVETIPDEVSIYADSNADEGFALYKNPYLQQSYTISRSISEMVELLQDYLQNYPQDSLISNAFNMYTGIVNIPKHEADAKEFIPLSAVLIHNNCMYLAHHAETNFPNCEDSIPLLRTKAAQAFTYMMKTVRTHLNGMISQAMVGLEEDTDTAKNKRELQFLAIAAEFERLDRIFKAVLPALPWREALATLIDHTLNEICSKVLSCEDISANTANELADSFTKLAVETATVFQKENMTAQETQVVASKAVPKWDRFRLLTFVLTASMRDIGDKWVNGCGPLSAAFTAEEIRKLVRALFQNTDHRAAFLASIK